MNKYPLPRISSLFDQLKGASHFSQIDLQSSYHQLRVRRMWHSQDCVIDKVWPFWIFSDIFYLTNALTIFIDFMNRVLKSYLDMFVVGFIDDVLVYFWSKEKHMRNLRVLLQILKDERLFAKFDKCELLFKEVAFIGNIVSGDWLKYILRRPKWQEIGLVPWLFQILGVFLGLVGY